nr:NAD-dependent epimerase/dehydratase family protein [Halobacteriovorax sp. HLS]
MTGGAGFVGSNLGLSIKKDYPEYEVTAFDNLKRRGSEIQLHKLIENGINFVHGDIRTREDLFSLEQDFDLMIEASAEPSVHAGSDGSPDYLIQTNLFGTVNCLEFARKHCRGMIFLSTSRVYSISDLVNIPLTKNGTRLSLEETERLVGLSEEGISEEFNILNYRSLYGATKLSSELLIQEYAQTYDLNVVINRCGVIAGPGQWGKVDQGVFTLWVANHFFKKSLRYTGFGGEGLQVRDLLHPSDLYEAVVAQWGSLDKFKGQVFNLGGGNLCSTSLLELTKVCEEVTGNKIEISSVAETAANDIPWYVTDNTKFKTAFNWEVKKNVKDIVEDIYNWLKSNEKDVAKIFNS